MDMRTDQLTVQEMHRFILTAVSPRPIGWISSISLDGHINLAPFSYFNAICTNPPLLGFGVTLRQGDDKTALGTQDKDTLANVRETREFVVNVVTYDLVNAMNVTSGDYRKHVNEFDLAGVSMMPSQLVKSPRVAESPVNFECKLVDIHTYGSELTGGSFIVGEVIATRIDDSVLTNGKIDSALLDVVARMGGRQYCRATDRFELDRPLLKTSSGL